ncbi:MAG: hypothetical protein RIK87_00690 [Fuerstiella sp.]
MISTEPFGKRPTFDSPEHWLEHFDESTAKGERPWQPATRGELLLADELGLLEVYRHWIPQKIGLRLLGLPDHFGQSLEPYSERFRERFLATLVQDADFCSAVASCLSLNGGPA